MTTKSTTTRPRLRSNPALKRATCAALLAATFAVPVNAEAITSIERYCSSSWRQAGIPLQEWSDCTQETMVELLSRVPQQRIANAIAHPDSEERRELMRSVWCIAQRWRRNSKRSPVSLEAVEAFDPAAQSEDADRPFDDEAVAAAIDNLNATQQQIIRLFCDGHSISEIADQLDIPPARVSDQKYKAIRELKKRLA